MRRLLRSSPLRCHRHGSLKPQSRKAASSETQAPSPVFIAAVLPEHQEASKSRKPPRRRSTTKRQSGKASRSAKASRSVIAKLQEAAQRRSVKEPPTKGWLCLEGDGLAYGKRSATKGWLCLEGDGLAYCETIRSEFRRTMADVMATPKRLKRSIRLNEWQFSFLFG